jgi:hypothetical protein
MPAQLSMLLASLLQMVAAPALISAEIAQQQQQQQYALSLKPAAPLKPASQLFLNASLQSWGGNVVRGDATDPHAYHLFAAAFTNGCGLAGWVRSCTAREGQPGWQHRNLG